MTVLFVYILIGILTFFTFTLTLKNTSPSVWDMRIWDLTYKVNRDFNKNSSNEVSFETVELWVLIVGSLLFMMFWPIFLLRLI